MYELWNVVVGMYWECTLMYSTYGTWRRDVLCMVGECVCQSLSTECPQRMSLPPTQNNNTSTSRYDNRIICKVLSIEVLSIEPPLFRFLVFMH